MSSRRKAGDNTKTRSQKLDAMARKKDERAVKRACRQEKKMESYLADDHNFVSFSSQMSKMGLQLRDIPGDGNCLFRALGDQLEGGGLNHARHRSDVVRYMLEHRNDFEPFVEDDIPFDRHVANLKKQGTYAGNDAIVAFARLHKVNVVIHQLNSPMWTIKGTDALNAPELHISYHNGDHYSSVRKTGDSSNQPASIKLKAIEQAIEKAKSLNTTNGYYNNDQYGNYGSYGYENYGNSFNYSDSGYNSYNNHGYGPGHYSDSVYNDSCATMDLHNGYDSDYDNVHASEMVEPTSQEGLAKAVRSTEDIIGQIMRTTCCQNRGLVEALLVEHGYNAEMATEAVIRICAKPGYEDLTSVSSYHTADSGIWSDNGTGTRIFGTHAPSNGIPNGTAVAIQDDSMMQEFEQSSNGAKPKKKALKSRDKKDQKKMEKNKKKEEKHRAKFLGDKNIPPPDYSDEEEDEVITSQMGMLQI